MKKAQSKKKKGGARLGGHKVVTHGFLAEEITPDQWVLGSAKQIAGPILMPGGHGWKKYLPVLELQHKNGFDSMNCSNYGTNNNWETLANFHGFDDFPKNVSERYTGVLTGTTKQGNYPHKVAEIIRHPDTGVGLIAEELLPFSDDIATWEEYYSPTPMDPALLAKGRALLQKFELHHDWVFVNGTVAEKQEKIKHALQYSTLGVSVLAWKERKGMFFKKVGEADTHWVELYDYEEGVCWWIYDHYDKAHKKLEWDYDFGYAKRYALNRKIAAKKKGFLAMLAEAVQRFFADVARSLNVEK